MTTLLPMVLAHHPYDTLIGGLIALSGIVMIWWAERRMRKPADGGSAESETASPSEAHSSAD